MTPGPTTSRSRIAAANAVLARLVLRQLGALLLAVGFLAAGAGVIEAGLRAPPVFPDRTVLTSHPGGGLPGRVEVAQALTAEAGRAIGPLLRLGDGNDGGNDIPLLASDTASETVARRADGTPLVSQRAAQAHRAATQARAPPTA